MLACNLSTNYNTNQMNYTIAIVDDHPLFIEGFKSYLSLNSKIERLETAANGQQFIELVQDGYEPHIVFMDIMMPVMDGIDATRHIKTHHPHVKVIALSSLESLEHVEKMIDAGVDGYLLKEATPDEINKAIEAVMNENNYFSNKIVLSLSKRAINGISNQQFNTLAPLTGREKQLLVLLCKGMSRKEIAGSLHISEKTVDKHKENILAKTGCKNLIRLVIFSIKNKLVSLDALTHL